MGDGVGDESTGDCVGDAVGGGTMAPVVVAATPSTDAESTRGHAPLWAMLPPNWICCVGLLAVTVMTSVLDAGSLWSWAFHSPVTRVSPGSTTIWSDQLDVAVLTVPTTPMVHPLPHELEMVYATLGAVCRRTMPCLAVSAGCEKYSEARRWSAPAGACTRVAHGWDYIRG